jgi:putative ABC transport system permease protein
MNAALLREAVAGARSQLVASVLTIAMVAGMCAAALLTTGRTVAAEQAVLAEIDAAGTRSIVVRAGSEAGLTVEILDRLRAVAGIEQATGFGPIVDARNAAVPGAPPVALRPAYGVIGERSMQSHQHPAGLAAVTSPAGARALGLPDGTGGLRTDHGQDVVVVSGDLAVPTHLRFLEPLAVIPSSGTGTWAGEQPHEPLALLVVLAHSPPEVAAVETVIRGLLTDAEPGTVTIETSAQLAAIRAAIGGELGTHARATVLAILAIAALLVTVNLLALVTMRRKDFGRRRALGATRGLIITLLLTQVALLALAGAALGTASSLAGLATTGNPLPGAEFTMAVAIASLLVATLAALPPAIIAARRDPLHELRVP